MKKAKRFVTQTKCFVTQTNCFVTQTEKLARQHSNAFALSMHALVFARASL
jgi:hypothetical protein